MILSNDIYVACRVANTHWCYFCGVDCSAIFATAKEIIMIMIVIIVIINNLLFSLQHFH
jgi:hypothetical protein